MPKQKLKLWTKIKFALFWIFKYTKGSGTITTCGNCKSIRIAFNNSKQERNVYTSEYECKDCGASAKCTEVWNLK